jgi:hypothetical protein
VGHRVTNLFESLLHTAPTNAQLTTGVNELRHGGVKVLRKDLMKMAASGQTSASAAGSVNISAGS